jgi:hypothetical protein
MLRRLGVRVVHIARTYRGSSWEVSVARQSGGHGTVEKAPPRPVAQAMQAGVRVTSEEEPSLLVEGTWLASRSFFREGFPRADLGSGSSGITVLSRVVTRFGATRVPGS